MEEKLFSAAFIFSLFIFHAQSKIDSLYTQVSTDYNILPTKNIEIQSLEDLKTDFEFTIDKLLLYDNFKDPMKKKDILTPFNLVYPKNKINGNLLNTTQSIESYKDEWLDIYKSILTEKKLKYLKENNNKEKNELENYLIKNLQRLKISINSYNRMNEDEQRKLWQNFKD